MTQFDTGIVDKLIYETKPNKIIFLAGENGTGKSRLLEHISKKLYQDKYNNIVAISNSSYTRFPSRRDFRKDHYYRYISGDKRNKPSRLIKNILSDRRKLYDGKIIYGLTKILDYLGFSQEIGIAIDLKNNLRDIHDPNYENCDIDYERYRNIKYFELLEKNIKKLTNDLYFNQENESISNSLIYLRNSFFNNHKIQWIELPNVVSETSLDFIISLLEIESKLGDNLKLNIYCRKKNSSKYFTIDSVSSGESSLFSTLQFIQSRIDSFTWILIDEPENSLHPKWQRDYCRNILDMFSLYEPKIIIATHSPMIVSGASEKNKSYNNYRNADKVYTPNSSNPHYIDDVEGVESLLMEVFDTLTPKNHNLSVKAQHLLEKLAKRNASLNETRLQISEWIEISTDSNQIKFLEELDKLAIKLYLDIYENN